LSKYLLLTLPSGPLFAAVDPKGDQLGAFDPSGIGLKPGLQNGKVVYIHGDTTLQLLHVVLWRHRSLVAKRSALLPPVIQWFRSRWR
jgi:hypothetical protein